MSRAKTFSYSIYLAKPKVFGHEVLTKTALERLSSPTSIVTDPIRLIGENSELILYESDEKIPEWANALADFFNFENPFSRSASAILMFTVASHQFMITWGHGSWQAIDRRKTVNDFGLRCVVNMVDAERLSSLSRSNILNSLQGNTYSPFGSSVFEFNIDDAFEVFKKLSGPSPIDRIKSASGGRSLTITCEHKLDELPKLCTELIKHYESKSYKNTSFRIIDELCPISDLELIDELDEALVKSIASNSGEFELSLPEREPGKLGYVKLAGLGHGIEPASDTSIERYLAHLKGKDKAPTLEDLNDDQIILLDDNEETIGKNSIRNSLIGSLVLNRKRYSLNDGNWYNTSDREYKSANEYFGRTYTDLDKKLDAWGIAPKTRTHLFNGRDESEREYLLRISKSTNLVLFDQHFLESYKGAKKELELCDLFDPEALRFIHVKRNSRNSKMVTYLLEQGRRAAREFKVNEHVRQQFFDALLKKGLSNSVKKLKAANPEDVTFEFRIGDYPRRDGKYTIPFFSRLALKANGREIESYGYNLAVGFIPRPRP